MNETIPIAAVVIAKNEASNIQRCLESLAWCDEVVVIDDHSDDETANIALSLGAKVVTHSFESFARQRNWALEHCELQADWVLMLDADEVSTPEFSQAIQTQIRDASQEIVAFKTCRKTMFMGTWLKYSDGFPVWIMRVVKRGKACFEDSGHGEVPVPEVNGMTGMIREPFLHFSFSKGINDWLLRHVKYAQREAKKELEQEVPVRIGNFFAGKEKRRAELRCLSRKLPARSLLRFCYQFFWKWGFLDGYNGFVFCKLMAFYEGLIVLKKKEMKLKSYGKTSEKENQRH